MRLIKILALIFLIQYSYGQISRKEIAESKLFIRATYIDQKNEIIGLQLRTDLIDTIIDNTTFRKFKTEDFLDYSQIDKTAIYYESFFNESYKLLDNNRSVIHSINYTETKEQDGILFGNKAKIALEFIDTRNSFPRDSLRANEKTPRKYFIVNNKEVYLVIIPDLKTLAIASNGEFYTKQLYGDNYNDISEGIKNNYQATNRFEIQKGDEIQLFYRRKWYNDSTGIVEYQDKQFKNIKYTGDTIIDNNKSLRLESEGYNYLSGSKEDPTEFLIQVTDSGYFYSTQFIPFKNYKTDLKILEQNGSIGYILQGVSIDTINGFSYQKIIQAMPGPYRYFILPFFPMPFIEFGNVQGIITYSKIKGVEKGIKRERDYITDKNNIRDIASVSDKKVEIKMYFLNTLSVDVEIRDPESNELLGSSKIKSKKGLNTFVLKTKKLVKGELYSVQINYKGEKESGSISSGFNSKY